MSSDRRNEEKRQTLLADMRVDETVYNVAEGIKAVSPSNVSKTYINEVRVTEKKLTDNVDMYNRRLESVTKSTPRTKEGVQRKNQTTATLKKKVTKAETKKNVYVSKGYRKQSIKSEVLHTASNKLTTSVKSSLLGTGNTQICKGTSTKSSNLLGIGDRKQNFSPQIKKAKFAKNVGKTLRESTNVMRNMKIATILNDENAVAELTKQGIIGAVNAVVRLGNIILKEMGKLTIRLLMPIFPYLLLCFVPLILIIVGAASSASDTSGGYDTVEGNSLKSRVMERAKSYVGEDGTRIWEHYGMKNHWCCMFIWTCFDIEEAGSFFYDGNKTAYVPDLYNWAMEHPELIVYFKNNNTGYTTGDPSAGEYGDIVIYDYAPYDNDSDHVAFILGLNENGYYTTIEGNTGGSGAGAAFYTSSKVNMYTEYLHPNSKMLQIIIRPDYNAIVK